MEEKKLIKLDFILLGCILFIAIVLRLYHINSPLTDFHSWRQADTAAVARNFTRTGFDLLKPKFDDLSSIQSARENPQGLRFVEFPAYSAMIAVLYVIFPFLPVEVWGRIVSLFFSLIIIAIIYYLVFKEFNRTGAFFSAVIYAVFPAFVFFSRVVLPETTAVAFSFLAIICLYFWRNNTEQGKRSLFFSASVLCFALATLIKPTVVFFGFTLLSIFISAYRFRVVKAPLVYLYFIMSLAPLVLWRSYIQQYPEGIPANGWLITSVNTYEGQKNIFLKPAFFRWIFYERINLMIFGGFGSAFFLIGIFRKLKKPFLHLLLFSSFAYLFVFEGGNVQHEYYQTVIMPSLAVFTGIGIATIIRDKKGNFIHPVILYPVVIFFLVLSWSFSYYYKVRGFYTYPEDLNQMAKILDTFTKPQDKIITDRLGDTTLLYISDRKGAPMLYKTLEELKTDGYSYYMTDKKDYIAELKEAGLYKLLFENNQFALFRL